MLNVISRLSIKDVATTYVANVRGDRKLLIEFVESTPQPQSDRGKKWVIIVSSQIGCALRCRFCDASGYFYGNLS
ncbi:MAG: radical SAM protein, partial [Myxococcota bacterium]